MSLENICPPALIYLVFSVTQIVIDSSKGLYNSAIIKFGVTIIFTTLLNYLCQRGLGLISWIIVFIPFILMTLIITLLLFMFGINPDTGKLNVSHTNLPEQAPVQPDVRNDIINQQTDSTHGLYYDNYNDANVNTIM